MIPTTTTATLASQSTPVDAYELHQRAQQSLEAQVFPCTCDRGAAVYAMPHDLSMTNRQLLKHRVIDALAEGVKIIVLDFVQCGYVDSSALGVLVSLNKKCREAGAKLVLCGLNEDLRTYLEITHLDSLLAIALNVDAAIAATPA
jgi:anti-sigma B factor antagonist